ncbi:MAG: hypothetical protein H6742_10750 [Alphaproteobacteria bacterium]|nr:hypothetical protein [Alphaproteobacteria bacterium]
MPLSDVISAALSGPAGRIVEGPVRNIVAEVLRDHGYASPAEVQALKDDLTGLQDTISSLSAQVAALTAQAEALKAEADTLRAKAAAPAAAPAATKPAAAPAAAPAAVAKPAAAKPAAVPAEAERHGMTVDEYQTWRAQGLPGRVGPDGHVEIDGAAYVVDVEHAGKEYQLTRHKNPRVMVDGRMVGKTPVA